MRLGVEPGHPTAQAFEIHLEPGRFSSPHLFLMQEGLRVGFASSLVPKRVRGLLQSQNQSISVEKELIVFLSETGSSYPIHVHTERGVISAQWDPAGVMGSKTQLEVAGSRVRIQRLLVDKNNPDEVVRVFSKIGDGLIVDLEKNRLLRFSDASGWYLAQLLEETPAHTWPESDGDLQYEPEALTEEMSAFDEESYEPVLRSSDKFSVKPDGFLIHSEAFEISTAFFNDKKIIFPKEQRTSYLRDLCFRSRGAETSPRETNLLFRVTLSRAKLPTEIRIKGAALWDGQWFDMGDHFSKYFEHLHSLRSSPLRKPRLKKKMTEIAFQLLIEKNESDAEKIIHAEINRLGIEDADAKWEAGEYLRRFFKTFVCHQTEALLVSGQTWFLAGLNFQKWGALFWEVQSFFGGDLFQWLKLQEKNVETATLFLQLRLLHARLQLQGIELCFNQKAVQHSSVRVKVQAEQKTDFGWFEMHPEVFWEGKPVDDAEWRRILENQGILEDSDALWMLDDASLKRLEFLRDLLRQPAKHRKDLAQAPQRISRPQILDWILLRNQGAELELSVENEALVQRLLQFEKVAPKAIPDQFRGTLRDYQKGGYEWIAFLYEHRLGGCLADDMGLGKTVQAIVFLAGLKEKIVRAEWKVHREAKHLVVVPATLVFNWKQEFNRFYPDLSVYEYSGAGRRKNFEGVEVIITTYDIIRQESDFFEEQHFHVIIFDEAQFLKNIFARRTVSARKLHADFTLTLTGTPLENHIGEYFSILDLSLPGLLGNYEEFRRLEREGHWERLKKRAAPFVLRRKKDSALKELPAKTENEIYLRMTARQKKLYQKVVSKVQRTVRQAFEEKAAAPASLTALTAILRLRQVCVSPRLVDPKLHERSPKMEYLLTKLSELIAEDHSAIVFSQFTVFLDVLEEELQKERLDYLRMDGSTPTAKRKSLIDAFQCGAGPPIFLVSLKTGGVGLNLTRASYVFHLDPWWNPAVENQASDRVHRIGQKKNVFVTRLLMQHTIEEKMVLLKKRKAALYHQVLDSAEPRNTSSGGLLTREDFDFLLSH